MASPDLSGLAVLFFRIHPLLNPLPSRERRFLSPLGREFERGGTSIL
jgi:hypothetical protein